jgi:hypothetical protein
MAVDTRDKRFSMIGLTSPILREQQNPTGTIGALARAMLLFLYAGILPAAPITPGTPPRNRVIIVGPRLNVIIVPPRLNTIIHDP